MTHAELVAGDVLTDQSIYLTKSCVERLSGAYRGTPAGIQRLPIIRLNLVTGL